MDIPSLVFLSFNQEDTGRTFSIRAVFYEVDPGDLTGKFGEELRRHEERETPETVNRWRTALKRLEAGTESRFCSRDWVDDSKMLDDLILSLSTLPANYTGPEKKQAIDIDLEPTELILTSYPTLPANYSGPEKKHAIDIDLELTELILTSDTHLKHLPQKSLPVSEERQNTSFSDYDSLDKSPSPASDDSDVLVGMHRHKIAVYDLLDLETMMNNVRTVGICGESGVGKTTLAECVFNDISPRFQHYCFLSSVNNIYRNRISPSLLQHLTRKKRSDNIFDSIKPFLVDRNVLLVIDGAHDTADHMQLKDAMKDGKHHMIAVASG
ncbi:unnamed protein product [Eruca vesicaria subsp. sativa]|uniref:Uncharacterized protein n=1 Tax=Eruca vesicaria subsp. sativa TaxID=29727 RepID=A0ABC8JNJ5_ERUVS|nr:unnamed protein product [Eruca vesicaria subsp. sativa]